jgi:hypothetical protein
MKPKSRLDSSHRKIMSNAVKFVRDNRCTKIGQVTFELSWISSYDQIDIPKQVTFGGVFVVTITKLHDFWVGRFGVVELCLHSL